MPPSRPDLPRDARVEDFTHVACAGAPRSAGSAVRRLSSGELFGGASELVIIHAGREYRLRVTSNGKLILTA
jgi:hemin uptake protein HemP